MSNFGRIKSYCNNKEHILKPYTKRGYLYVGLCNDKKQKRDYRVHVLVMQAFKPCNKKYGLDKYHIIHHIDCDKTNNCLNNLMWCTVKEHCKIHANIRKNKIRR